MLSLANIHLHDVCVNLILLSINAGCVSKNIKITTCTGHYSIVEYKTLHTTAGAIYSTITTLIIECSEFEP